MSRARDSDRTRELASANEALERSNRELRQHERITQSLLQDLQHSKEQLEQQRQILQDTNKQLQELALLKDEFVAKVSHEFRTPLTAVKEGLNLLLDNALGETTAEQQEFLRTMDGDIDRLSELINNMLDISKIEAGRLRLQRCRIDLHALLTALISSYRSLLGHRTAVVRGEGLPPVFADAHRMTQVFGNLFSNAMKFTNDTGRITFRIRRQGDDVAVAVEDNGPGIAPEDLTKLFQKFSQVGAPSAGQPRGTGLGLVVCKELTEMHGGRIDVNSTPGRGTTFTVRLPAYSDALALHETFQETRELASVEHAEAFGLLAVQAAETSALERVADEVRRHIHGGDLVLLLDTGLIVVLAVADARGLEAMMRRLGEMVRLGGALTFGAALFPADGRESRALFERAVSRVGHGLSPAALHATMCLPAPSAGVAQAGKPPGGAG